MDSQKNHQLKDSHVQWSAPTKRKTGAKPSKLLGRGEKIGIKLKEKMATLSDTPVLFSLNNTEYSDGENSDADNSEPITADFFIPQSQESGKVGEPQPSCSGLHLKPQPRSLSRSRKVAKPSYPWKLVLPKRGISKLIFQVVASTERRGISLQGIKKCVVATGYDLERRKYYFKRVLRALLAKGLLRKLTGRGLTGSYAVSGMMRKVMRRRQRRRKRTSGSRKKGAPKGKGKPRKKKAKATEPDISPDINAVPC